LIEAHNLACFGSTALILTVFGFGFFALGLITAIILGRTFKRLELEREIDRRVGKNGNGWQRYNKTFRHIVERKRYAHFLVIDLKVVELVLQNDRHLAGIPLAQIIGDLHARMVGEEGDIKMVLACKAVFDNLAHRLAHNAAQGFFNHPVVSEDFVFFLRGHWLFLLSKSQGSRLTRRVNFALVDCLKPPYSFPMLFWPSLAVCLTLCSGFLTLLWLCAIDLKLRLLPDELTILLAVLGALFVWAAWPYAGPWYNALFGALAGGGSLLLVRTIANKLYGFETMGLGDVKLLAAGGIWLGLEATLMALCVGAFAGVLQGVITMLYLRKTKDKTITFRDMTIPAGPGFCVGLAAMAAYTYRALPLFMGAS
jgi:prepilin signal peptidase PulO-like enzyme (type II secretory pathway)